MFHGWALILRKEGALKGDAQDTLTLYDSSSSAFESCPRISLKKEVTHGQIVSNNGC